jgi:hypothetical protein
MIYLPVDESYAFDYLAILMTKAANGLEVQADLAQVTFVLKNQIGDQAFSDVLESSEFNQLCYANNVTFEMVEKAMSDKCKASDVDRSNQARMAAKAALQKRFFYDHPMQELKTARPLP